VNAPEQQTLGDRCLVIEAHGPVRLIRMNRPEVLNALNDELMNELSSVLDTFETDPSVRCVVLTGSEKVFAAGADIDLMQRWSYMDVYMADYVTRNWERIASFRKPIIAAVAGYALGGGFEIAMMCDFIIAADNAKFGQPEIRLGVIPGAGGSQRLTRAIGKAKSMDLCMTGRYIDATEAERTGVVARVVPLSTLVEDSLEVAGRIAAQSLPAIMMLKEAVNRSFETTLSEGVRFERRLFHSMFSLQDQKEGMGAFLEKRSPQFTDR
jgi:enoyl-CoA hydratase